MAESKLGQWTTLRSIIIERSLAGRKMMQSKLRQNKKLCLHCYKREPLFAKEMRQRKWTWKYLPYLPKSYTLSSPMNFTAKTTARNLNRKIYLNLLQYNWASSVHRAFKNLQTVRKAREKQIKKFETNRNNLIGWEYKSSPIEYTKHADSWQSRGISEFIITVIKVMQP